MKEPQSKVLIVDDEPEILRSCEKLLRSTGAELELVESGKEAEKRLNVEDFDLILCDLMLPDIHGLQLLKLAKRLQPHTPFIVFTAYGTVERAVEAMKLGAFDFIQKPFKNNLFLLAVERALKHRRLLLRNLGLEDLLKKRYRFEELISANPRMQQIFELIQRVAPTDTSVLIMGESGTGKEMVARSIHRLSLRSDKPFVPVNCGALPEGLFESELFGHEKGAFTGAIRQKKGLLEYANGGTFFLDEVFELPVNLQVKLLRMLQEKRIRRVGGEKPIPVDVRILSATNSDVQKGLREGKIRDDFFYRLAVITIELPPLRERKEDIPLLAQHFIEQYAEILAKPVEGLASETLSLLEAYNWPGNIRELQNVIERAVTLTTSGRIQPEDLPPHILANPEDRFLSTEKSYREARQAVLDRFDRAYLIYLLQKHGGNVSKVAQHMGFNRRSIHRMLHRLHIDPALFRSHK